MSLRNLSSFYCHSISTFILYLPLLSSLLDPVAVELVSFCFPENTHPTLKLDHMSMMSSHSSFYLLSSPSPIVPISPLSSPRDLPRRLRPPPHLPRRCWSASDLHPYFTHNLWSPLPPPTTVSTRLWLPSTSAFVAPAEVARGHHYNLAWQDQGHGFRFN